MSTLDCDASHAVALIFEAYLAHAACALALSVVKVCQRHPRT
jgi:hypothetical protein